MENQVSSKIVGIGDITMTTNTRCKLVLKDVRHVPDMRLNLIQSENLMTPDWSTPLVVKNETSQMGA